MLENMPLTSYNEVYKFRAAPGFFSDLDVIKRADSSAATGLTFLLQEVRSDESLRTVMQQQSPGEISIPLGGADCCEIKEFRLTGGRLVWRIKPIVAAPKWAGFETVARYRIFYAPNVNGKELVFLCAALRVGEKGDIYAPTHRIHKRVCDRYDRCGLRQWGVA